MKTEDLPLNIKEIFERKKAEFNKYDVARMRYLCKTFIGFIIDLERGNKWLGQTKEGFTDGKEVD